jgi:hypothetical protein
VPTRVFRGVSITFHLLIKNINKNIIEQIIKTIAQSLLLALISPQAKYKNTKNIRKRICAGI